MALLHGARHAMYAAVGFLKGASIAPQDVIVKRLVEQIKAIEEA